MRCRNCGWDNPNGNVKCEKCNASMNDAIVDVGAPPPYEFAQDDFNPRATVATIETADFNPRATIIGCVSCGYPVRPDDATCPICGNSLSGNKKEPEIEAATSKGAIIGGTIIQGVNFNKEKTETERKKLTGFLVTYSHALNGEFFPLYEGKNYVGRSDSSNVIIQGDSSVSEKHLSILYRTVDRKFKFKDEQSSNGTFINGELIDEGELKNHDLIRIGSTQLVFMEIPLSSFE